MKPTALIALVAAAALLTLFPVRLSAAAPAKVTKADRCPVCGMFVAKYPDFLAQVVLADETVFFFDGAKDMFKYLADRKKYTPAKAEVTIESVIVTDYYTMQPIDGRGAWYVLGSDVYGPMGRELIPFARQEDAEAFAKDHGGRRQLRFGEVTPELVRGLD